MNFIYSINEIKKKLGLLKLAGLYAVLAAAVVFPVLFYLNNYYFADAKTQSTVSGSANAIQIPNPVDSGSIADKMCRLSGIPAGATDISFSYDNRYCTYLFEGIVYVRRMDTDEITYEIKDGQEIKKAVLMDDRNILISLTMDEKNGLQSSGSVGITTYNIEKNARIAQKSFTMAEPEFMQCMTATSKISWRIQTEKYCTITIIVSSAWLMIEFI